MKYRKKPVVVEAVRWTGDNWAEIKAFCPETEFPKWRVKGETYELYIHTLEGDHRVNTGDYIIRGVSGEYYPCKPDIFEKTYEPVEG